MTDKRLTALKTTNSLQRLAEMRLKMTRYSKQNTDLSDFIRVKKTSGLAIYKKPTVEPIKQSKNLKQTVNVEQLFTRNTAKLSNCSYEAV